MLARRICRSVPSGSVDGVQGDVRVGRLDVVRHLDVGQLGAPDRPLLVLDGQGVPGVQVVQVLLHDDVAAAGEAGSASPIRAAAPAARPTGFSVPSTKPSRSRSSKYRNPCTSSTTVDRARQPGHDLAGEFEAQVHPVVPDMEQQVPGRGYGAVPVPAQLRNGCSSAGRGPANRRSQPCEPDPGDAGQARLGRAEPDRPLQPGPVAEQVPAAAPRRPGRWSAPGRSRRRSAARAPAAAQARGAAAPAAAPRPRRHQGAASSVPARSAGNGHPASHMAAAGISPGRRAPGRRVISCGPSSRVA